VGLVHVLHQRHGAVQPGVAVVARAPVGHLVVVIQHGL
jgi:hypothetical protein